MLVFFDEFLIGLGLLIVLCLVPEKMEENKVMSFPFCFCSFVSSVFCFQWFCFWWGDLKWDIPWWVLAKVCEIFLNLFYFLSIFEYFGCLMIHGTCVIDEFLMQFGTVDCTVFGS